MATLKRITCKQRIRDGLKTATVILLLAIYIAGSTGYGAFHRLLHKGGSFIAHSAEQEKDPCHRVIYHCEKDNVCKHDSHFSVNDKCGQCHILCKPDQVTALDPFTESVEPGTIMSVILIFSGLGEIFVHHPSRAPPLS